MLFNEFNLSKQILKSLTKTDYLEATPIQEEVIPLVLNGSDIIGKAQTGSGKTASFVLPVLNRWMNNPILKKRKISILVLAPTRELVNQVSDTFNIFSKFLSYPPKIITIIGGQDIGKQLLGVQKGCDIVVATSGRLLDIIDKKQIDLSSLEYLILDEADKMLDMGFSEELDMILELIPSRRQNLLFSATYPDKMKEIAKRITINPTMVTIENKTSIVDTIEQRVIELNKENRSPLLRELIKKNSWDKVLVFMANKRATDNIAAKFRKYGFLAESFHGDLEQNERELTLQDFKDKKIRILFSTDIASRGLHIEDISCVINFDLPRSADDYVHRIGRTGRAGNKGIAVSFVGLEEQEHFKLIEKRCKINIEKEQIEGFELIGKPLDKVKGQAPIKGKRKSKKDKLREEKKLS